MKTIVFVSAVLLIARPTLHSQGGSLIPPGPPGPSMKSLDKVEPRTPVTSLPFTISQPGSYYFTGNLQFTAASGDAITISASNVTLDLMGFTLSSTDPVTGSAITSDSSQSRICIQNGRIAGKTSVTTTGTPPAQIWSTSPGGFAYGVELSATKFCRTTHLDVSGCRESGVYLGANGRIEDVIACSNGAVGISVTSGVVSNCIASTNGNVGVSAASSVVCNVQSSFNAGGGINADAGGCVTTCTVISNGATGILVTGGSATNCVAKTTGQNGIDAATGTVTNCTSNSNGNFGIVASGGVVAFSKATGNSNVQINVPGGTVTGNNP